MDKSKFPRKTMGEYGKRIRARLRHPSNRKSEIWTDRAVAVEAARIATFGNDPMMHPAASASNLPSS